MQRGVPALLLCAFWLSLPAWPACPFPPRATPAEVAHVIDGDTLVLSNETRVRLIGIDAPELGRDGAPDAPFADEAREAVRASVDGSAGRVQLLAGRDDRDRHGRTLAHVYAASGTNLSELLLRRGLALLSSFPPNLGFLDCYREAELAARQAGIGLWRLPPVDAGAAAGHEEGFLRIRGRVRGLDRGQGMTRIRLDGGLRLRIHEGDRRHFDVSFLEALRDRIVEVRGWLYRYRGQPRMRLRHPSAFVEPAP
jgi:endonuclease YncB( thermonuclease family)